MRQTAPNRLIRIAALLAAFSPAAQTSGVAEEAGFQGRQTRPMESSLGLSFNSRSITNS